MHSLFFHMLSSIHPNLLGVIGAAAGTCRLLVSRMKTLKVTKTGWTITFK
jgi:hypothetical protein